MLSQKRITLQNYSNEFIARLKHLHVNFDKYQTYPRDPRFQSAIYDSDKKQIFSTLKSDSINLNSIVYTSNKKIHFIKEPESYYLGSKYVILEIDDDLVWNCWILFIETFFKTNERCDAFIGSVY